MYAIAYKEGVRSSWKMMARVYEDREKAEDFAAAYKHFAKVVVVWVEVEPM